MRPGVAGGVCELAAPAVGNSLDRVSDVSNYPERFAPAPIRRRTRFPWDALAVNGARVLLPAMMRAEYLLTSLAPGRRVFFDYGEVGILA